MGEARCGGGSRSPVRGSFLSHPLAIATFLVSSARFICFKQHLLLRLLM